MKEAEIFYFDLVCQDVCEKNEEIHDRLLEMRDWKQAFVGIFKQRSHFRFVIHKKSKEFWTELLTRHGFSPLLIGELIEKIA